MYGWGTPLGDISTATVGSTGRFQATIEWFCVSVRRKPVKVCIQGQHGIVYAKRRRRFSPPAAVDNYLVELCGSRSVLGKTKK